MDRQRIVILNTSQFKEQDRLALCNLLMMAGYNAVHVKKEPVPGKQRQTRVCIEYWRESDGKEAAQ